MTTIKMSKKSKANLDNMIKSEINKAIARGMKKGLIKTEATTKRDYLSGQSLKVQTGRLRSSITTQVVVTTKKVYGIIGTNVWYGKIHELGYKGIFQISSYMRKVTKIFGRKSKGEVTAKIKAHTRKVDYSKKDRSFLKPAIEDNKNNFKKFIMEEVAKEIAGG